MTSDNILFVAGLGRCGTTMVMQMLHAAGTPCAGTPPAFEDIPVSPSRVDHPWLALQRGRVVKWIDPTVTRIKGHKGGVIFLSRDPMEQAKSQAKLLGVCLDRSARRGMANLIQRDTIRARRIVTAELGSHYVLLLRFEKVLAAPLAAACQIARACDALDLPFGDERAAAAVVLDRPAACAPDLAVEMGKGTV
jgi:hypothetical protein